MFSDTNYTIKNLELTTSYHDMQFLLFRAQLQVRAKIVPFDGLCTEILALFVFLLFEKVLYFIFC